MTRIVILSLVLIIILPGCSVYNNITMESYEKKEPYGHIDFLLKDKEVKSVEANQIAMVKSTSDLYIIYNKDGGNLEIRKDQVEAVRMADQKKIKTFGTVVFIGAAALSIIMVWAFLSLLE